MVTLQGVRSPSPAHQACQVAAEGLHPALRVEQPVSCEEWQAVVTLCHLRGVTEAAAWGQQQALPLGLECALHCSDANIGRGDSRRRFCQASLETAILC